MIRAKERETYTEMWQSVELYSEDGGGPGQRYIPVFQAYAPAGATVLDAGSGHGRVALALRDAGYLVTCCDLTDAGLVPEARALPFLEACLWQGLAPGHWEWGFCTDVLEHIPTQFVGLSVARLLEVCRDGLMMVVSLMPDELGVWVGRPLHLTVQPYGWWRDTLEELGELVDARDLISHGLFVLRPRTW